MRETDGDRELGNGEREGLGKRKVVEEESEQKSEMHNLLFELAEHTIQNRGVLIRERE